MSLEPSLTFLRLSVLAVCEPKNAGKKQNNKTGTRKRYISRMCGGAPVQPIVMRFGIGRNLADVINHSNLFIVRLKGLGLVNGHSLGVS